MSFTHLHVTSGYSFLDSTMTVDKLVAHAAKLDFTALALTDDTVLYGAVSFYQACMKHDIKPILGMVVSVSLKEEQVERCLLLAKTNQGYEHLIKISTLIQQAETKVIAFEDLGELTGDLIGILPVVDSLLAEFIQSKPHELAQRYVATWSALFAAGDFYLGLHSHGLTADDVLTSPFNMFYNTYDPPVVALQDVRYLEEGDAPAYACLQAIKADATWDPPAAEQAQVPSALHHLRTAEEMTRIFAATWPSAISATMEIAAKCQVTFDFTEKWLPVFPLPEGEAAHPHLEALCFKRVHERYDPLTEEVTDRLTYELEMIKTMQFSDYFLIVADFIAYAREENILVGPGRGSAAGSVVAYVLGITDVDPLRYGLLFERFLNPERVTMPDIDVDFSDHRRDEVIDYVRTKYGAEHVAQIITFGTFGTRSILRALFKTMAIDERDADFILQELPPQTSQTVASAVRSAPHLQDYVLQSEKLTLLFQIAHKLEGLPRHLSTHAAGVVVTEAPLIEHVPLTTTSSGLTLTQYPMNDLEAVGLLKIDFLGLRNLTLLEQIMASIKQQTGEEIALNALPLEDAPTFALLQQGKTNGVFQLESSGMKDVLMRLKPTTFEDIVAVNALYRPGPMEMIPTYIKRKHGAEAVTFLHPDLEPILTHTYGVLIYQEQIMQIASQLAGFSLGQADLLRRAVSKKEASLMAAQKEAFLAGCLAHGYDASVAEEIFGWIVMFSNYGFNRSHAVAYSKISYQLAYLKAHYPAHFLSILLSGALNQHGKMKEYIDEAEALGVPVTAPSINHSFGRYTVEGESIRMGLLAVNGINQPIVQEVVRARQAGKFTSLFDFCLKVSLKIINRQTIERLILAGAFDSLHNNRASLIASIDQALEQGELFGDVSSGLLPNLLGVNERYAAVDDFTQLERLAEEKDLLGVYVSSHPLEAYRRALSKAGYIAIKQAPHYLQQRVTKGAVIIQAVREIRTKRGDPMAFVTLSDETGDIEGVVFPELYRKQKPLVTVGTFVFVSGKVDERNNQVQWVINHLSPFVAPSLVEQQIFVRLRYDTYEMALLKLQQVSKDYPGEAVVIVHDPDTKQTYQLAPSYSLQPQKDALETLQTHFGDTNVILAQAKSE